MSDTATTITGTGAQSASIATSGGTSPLLTEQGRTTIADSVVVKVAGMATREIAGVHEMGSGRARALGGLKEKLPGTSSTPSVSQGVSVEVGERQAAVDLDVVVEYGVSIVDVAESIRRNVIRRVQAMTGLEVTEVNITVDDVFLGESDTPQQPRVS